jgi:tRNA(fMet)-specific endonuclease VapC
MTPVLVDTDILSRFFRNDPVVIRHFNHYVQLHNKINISIITHYEVLSGLLHQDLRICRMLLDSVHFCSFDNGLVTKMMALPMRRRMWME